MLYMLLVSFFVMYGVMFLNVDQPDHIYLSLTRTYMALLMVSPMALIMLVMMPAMYTNRKRNRVIGVGAVTIFVISLYLLRSQSFIEDSQYMRGMISHHSSAIMTSRHANLKDPDVKRLSENIIKSQREEIEKMKALLAAERQ